MIDADAYWGAYDALVATVLRNGSKPKIVTPKREPTPDVAAEPLPGGCLLYRLPQPAGVISRICHPYRVSRRNSSSGNHHARS